MSGRLGLAKRVWYRRQSMIIAIVIALVVFLTANVVSALLLVMDLGRIATRNGRARGLASLLAGLVGAIGILGLRFGSDSLRGITTEPGFTTVSDVLSWVPFMAVGSAPCALLAEVYYWMRSPRSSQLTDAP